jgi:hypothetical protein
MYNACLHTTILLPRAPTALTALVARKTIPKETNTTFFRVIMLCQDLRSVLYDLLMVVWLNSPIICPPARFPLFNNKGPFTSLILISVHLHISLCWTSRVPSQTRYSHLSTCTFPTVECQLAVHKLDTSVHLHISSVERQGSVHKLDTHICPPAHFPLLNVKGPFKSSIRLSTCTFRLLRVKGPFTSSIFISVHLHIPQCWPAKGQFLQCTSTGPLQASFFCPLRPLILHIFLNFSLWTAHSFLPHYFSIHVNQTRSHVRWGQYVPPKRRITHYHTA